MHYLNQFRKRSNERIKYMIFKSKTKYSLHSAIQDGDIEKVSTAAY
ncbi:hypothetical protein [Orientia tsutsugamushi]